MASNLPALSNLTELQEKFIQCIPNHKTLNDAAREAGYSPAACKNIKQHIAKSPKLQNAIKQTYLTNNICQLPQIINIEQTVLDLIQNDITQLPKYRNTIKEIKQQIGVLQNDVDYGKPTHNHIAINARQLLIQLSNSEQIQDAEVIE